MTTKLKKQAAIKRQRKFRSKVALLGFGTVGSSVAQVLAASKFPGVELTHIFNRNVERKRDSAGRQTCAGVGRVDGRYRCHSAFAMSIL